MNPTFSVDVKAFGTSIAKLSALNGKTQAQTLLSFAKTTLRNRDGSGLIDITPPASKDNVGPRAKIQGEAAIDRDLRRVFFGVNIKDKKRERHPNIEAIHRRHLIAKKPGAPMVSDSAPQKYFVDIIKLRALRRKLVKHVGRLASGWLVAARRLGVSVPAWIGRHGTGNGGCRIKLTAPRYEIEMTMIAPKNSPAAELERRVRYALLYTQGRLDRAVQAAINPAARKAGFFTLKK